MVLPELCQASKAYMKILKRANMAPLAAVSELSKKTDLVKMHQAKSELAEIGENSGRRPQNLAK